VDEVAVPEQEASAITPALRSTALSSERRIIKKFNFASLFLLFFTKKSQTQALVRVLIKYTGLKCSERALINPR
jgi:hypothetical protein